MTSPLIVGLALYVGWLVYTLLYVLLTAHLARRFGLAVCEVKVGFGPTIFMHRFDDGVFSVRLFPFSGTVDFRDRAHSCEIDAASNPLLSLSHLQRLVLDVVGPVSNAALGLLVLALSQSPVLLVAGLLGIYLCVLNLLPLPGLNGFDAAISFIPALRAEQLADVIPTWCILITLLVVWGTQVAFVYIMVTTPSIAVALVDYVRAMPPN